MSNEEAWSAVSLTVDGDPKYLGRLRSGPRLARPNPSRAQPRDPAAREWHHEDGAVVELESYGTARYRDLPLSIVSPSDHGDSAELVSGAGTWVYGDGLRFNDGTGNHVITVRVDQHLWTVQLRGSGDSMTLESLRDDPDGSDAYVLEKGACRSPADYEVNP